MLATRVVRRIRRFVGRRLYAPSVPARRAVYAIGILHGRSLFDLREFPNVVNPVITAEDVTDVRATMVADPFMLRTTDSCQMFFELINRDSGKGEIGLATSRDGVCWDYEQVVLAEPFHLSYPHVLEWEGDYYMIPESGQAGSVRLYRATQYPMCWQFVTTMIRGQCLLDATPFRFNGLWWMYVETNPELHFDTLRLFFAEDLPGPWREHPSSPVVDGNPHIARPAGRVQTLHNIPIRFGQNCCPDYGLDVRAFVVDELTTSNYHERPVADNPVLRGGGGPWNADGMHHIDAVHVEDGQWLACVDGWYWSEPGRKVKSV